MVTPFSKFQKIEDIVPLMDKEERLLYPLVDNTIMVLNKIINPYEEYVPLFDKNEATIVALYIKQTKLLNPNRSLEKVSCHFLMTAIRKTALYMLDS